MKNLFLAASGVLGVVPGLVTLQSGIGLPPGTKLLFGGTVEAFGAFVLVIIWANQHSLVALSKRIVTQVGIGFAVICFVLLLIYTSLVNFCVVEPQSSQHKEYGPVYYPLWVTGNVSELVDKAGSRTAALDRYGPEDIANKLNEMPCIMLWRIVTTAILLLLYQGIFTTLAAAFGLVALHAEPQTAHPAASASTAPGG
jgi:uncharacterized membrane protein